MTREEKLYSMRMQDLEIIAIKLGIKINKKAAKSKAIEKILIAEGESIEEIAGQDSLEQQELDEKQASKASNSAINKQKEVSKQNIKAKTKKTNLKLSELTYKGETKSIREWAEQINMPVPTLYDRVNRNGWSAEEAIEIPLGGRRKK